MKQCPQCRQTFSDDTLYCLSDGTPLIVYAEAPEEVTVVKPLISEEITFVRPESQNVRSVPPAAQTRSTPIFAYLAGVLFLLLLVLGVIGIAGFIVYRNWKTEPTTISSSNSDISNKDDGQNQLNKEKANLQEQQNQLEKEKQKLADERKRLNEEKNKTTETPPPVSTPKVPPPAAPYPAQPTARIKFGRGRVAETISGKVYTQRSFVLEAKSGQYLSASVSGGGCVTFSNGGTSLGYVTSSGDNRVTLVNNCNSESGFSLTVSIK